MSEPSTEAARDSTENLSAILLKSGCGFRKGDRFQIRIGAEVIGQTMENGDESFVGLTVGEVFPRVSHQHREWLLLKVRRDAVEHRVIGPVVGKEAGGMAEEKRAIYPPVRALEGFDE